MHNIYIKQPVINMSRSQPYRSKMPIEILKTMDVASRITLFLVGQSGPLSFTFKDRLGNKIKTSIGANLKCSCSPGKNDHCIHTLYVLLKIFRVQPQNPFIWQAAYVDSELTDLLSGRYTILTNRSMICPNFDMQSDFTSQLPSDFLQRKRNERIFIFPQTKAQRLKLNQDSVCPICQQQMTQEQCLSYCRVKCGNNFHLECLKIWAEHKSTTQTSITCPMCRTPFGQNCLKNLECEEKQFRKNEANKIIIKFKCSNCGIDEIPKNVHKCVLCTLYQLCEVCYKANKHIKHPFIRQVQNNPLKWCGGEERRQEELKMKKYIDNKRKQKNINQQLLQKLRKVEEDPSKLLDFVASTYPYVSKYISDNADPYKKMDLNPQDMRCMKCCSKKMIFLRRLACGHFIDHECLKQNFRKGKFYCDECGTKLVKGYQNLLSRQKQLQHSKEEMIEVSAQFNPRKMERPIYEQTYNFELPEEPTLAEVLGGERAQRNYDQQSNESRVRKRIASNLIRGTEVYNNFRNNSGEHTSTNYPRAQSITNRRTQQQFENATRNNNVRIRNIPKPPSNQRKNESEHRNHSNTGRKLGNKKTRQEMASIIQVMIGKKIF